MVTREEAAILKERALQFLKNAKDLMKEKFFEAKIGIFSPFEIHLVDEKEFEWYRRFIDKKVVV